MTRPRDYIIWTQAQDNIINLQNNVAQGGGQDNIP